MNKNLFKNSWILGSWLLVISIILSFIISAIEVSLKIKGTSISGIAAGIIGATIVGQIYAKNFKESMPKKLRVQVTAIYVIAQIVWISLYSSLMKITNLTLFFAIFFCLLNSLFVYWTLGFGGNSYFKAMQKKEAIKK